jgi:hypothetical protein
MSTIDFMIIAVVAGMITLALAKIVRDKKKGVKCSGCSGCCDCPDKGAHK